MKKSLYVVLVAITAGLIFAAFYNTHTDNAEAKGPTNVEMAGDLWDKIQGENYRSTWKMWPGKTAFYKGTHPHGALLTTYVTDSAYSAIKDKKGAIPNGGILIKENYMPNKKLGAITVMQKIKGYNPEKGDWFWVKFAPDGTPMTMEKDGMKMTLAGKVPGCIGCHSGQAANDFIFTSPVK